MRELIGNPRVRLCRYLCVSTRVRARARFLLVSLVASSRRRVVVATRLFDEIMTLSGYLGRAAATGRIIFSAEISRSLDLHVGGCTYEAGVARVVPDYDRRRYRTAGD